MKESSQTRANELPFSPPPQYGLPRTAIPQTVHTRQREIPEGGANEMSAYSSDSLSNSTTVMEEKVQSRVDGVSIMTPLRFGHRTVIPQTPITGERTVPQIDAEEIRYYSYPSNDVIEEYIERGLLRHNKEINDEEAVQRIVFQLITRSRLTTEMFAKLREKYLPSSFSKIKWMDVASRFRNLKPTFPNDHRRIPTFPLKRSRMPMIYFQSLIFDLDKSILRVGNRMSLRNEAAVHEYVSPIFNIVNDLFEGRVVNKPEIMLDGSIGRKGRCEYSYVFVEGLMLLLIELKLDLRSFNDADYSNIVAQVCAEADGCSVYNASIDLDRAPIQVILTDSLYWEFFYFDFSKIEVYRGETDRTCGFLSDADHFLSVPPYENAKDFLLYLKLVVETVLDTFISSYVYALAAVVEKVKKDNLGEDTVGLYSNAKKLGHDAIQTLREANLLRTNQYEADRIASLGLDQLKQSIKLVPNGNIQNLLSLKLSQDWESISNQ